MNDIKEIGTLELSKYINVFRQFLVKIHFFEHTLYSATPYKVEGVESFSLKNNLFLRYGTEPEIWSIGEHFDRFFWIGSLFRDEKTATEIHKDEFKVLDFYIKRGSRQAAVNLFLRLLNEAEKNLRLPELSKLKVRRVSYEDFSGGRFEKAEKYWLIVTNYPVEESFYDASRESGTEKFEIMFVSFDKVVEIATGGLVSDNLNKEMYIKKDQRLINKKLFRKFIGLGFGIERLMFAYSNFNK